MIGTYDNPTGISITFVCGIIAAYILFTSNSNKSVFWLFYIFFSFCIILSASRAGIITSLTFCAAIIVHSNFENSKKYAIILALMIVIILAFLLLVKKDSTIGHLLILICSISILSTDNILWGIGIYGFSQNYMSKQSDFLSKTGDLLSYVAGNVDNPLNEYLSLVIAYGAIGFFLLIIFILSVALFLEKKNDLILLLPMALFSFFSYPFKYPITWICLMTIIANFDLRSTIVLHPKKICYVVSLIIPLVLMFMECKDIEFETQWRKVAQNVFGEKVVLKYNQLYHKWNGNPYFLYNYSFCLEINENINESLKVLNQFKYYVEDFDTSISTARLYGKLNNHCLAEYYYKRASNMIPNKFLPKSLLLDIYKERGDTFKVIKLSQEILNTKIKVNSPIVTTTIEKAKSCINEYSEHYKLCNYSGDPDLTTNYEVGLPPPKYNIGTVGR